MGGGGEGQKKKDFHTPGFLLPLDPKEIHLLLKSSGLYTKLAKSCLLAKRHNLDTTALGRDRQAARNL